MRMLMLVIALAAAVVANNAQGQFTNFLDGSVLPGDAGWTVDGDAGTLVNLGGDNSGIRQVDDDPGAGGGQHGGSYDEFYLTVADPSNTLAARFRLEQYTPGDNLITPLALTAGGNENTPAIGLGIRNVMGVDRWQLVRFIFESNNPGDPAAILHDIAPVTLNQFNEALIHIDSDTDLVRFSWNGMELYNMVTPTDFGGADGFPEWGASNFWGEGGTSTVTYDWVGYGPGYIPPPGPATHTWNVDANGNWSLAANWMGGEPNAAGASASFLGAITAARTITVDGPKTVGSLTFNNAASYSLAGPGPLQIDSAAASTIEVTSGSHTISVPVMLADDTLVSVSPAAGSLSITGALSASAVNLTKAGLGTLTLSNLRAAGLSINSGTVAIAPGGTPASTSVLSTLSIDGGATPTAKLDLNNNAAIVNYTGTSPAATIRQQILAGRGGSGLGKSWNGQGITSSAAAAAEPESRSVGYAENSTLPLGPYTTFRGQPVDDTSMLMAFTRTGDANLDGVVNDDDVTIVGASYAPGVAGASWATGDFDYNGFVDDDDVTLLGVFYDPGAAPLVAPAQPGASGVAAVPEPGTVALLLFGLIGILLVRTVCRKPRHG
ncbi:MAG TPA: PEP-CTERM sorting domain-containing protein [Pirellulales bacterium]|nr:PEP-CTERM sorting domain-containing protein [Pirellulales bacterium]